MNRWFSLYLDFVRLFAAGFVVYAHTNARFLYPDKLPLAEFAHSAVTVFFVLSGYVVAFVVDKRENSPSIYAASRGARILSLSVLMVFLTPVLDVIGRSTAAELYLNNVPSDFVLIRIIASLTFLAEIWSLSIMTFSNLPYWSLNYEVWYYIIFGVYCFFKPSYKWIVISAICLFLGPKIVLMAPCWLAGVIVYRWGVSEKLNPLGAALLWVVSLIAFWGYHHLDLMRAFSDGFVMKYLGEWAYTQLNFSRYFAADWLLAVIISANFIAAKRLGDWLPKIKIDALNWVGFVGGLTYALYIAHSPFVYLWSGVLKSMTPGLVKYLAVLTLILLSVGVVAIVGERLRPRMRKWFESILASQNVRRWTSRWVNQPEFSRQSD
jgi:peptidoglycan/LPS O-acetylase OafA/YrhL